MSQKNIARGAATRSANKNKRRAHILSCAGQMIAESGLDAFTLGLLAERADVTVPTIHNLLGRKAQIFERLVENMVQRVGHVLAEQKSEDPITAVEAFIDDLMTLFENDEDLYRAAFIAGEGSKLFEHEQPKGIFNSALNLAISVCTNAKQQGYLKGHIDTNKLSHQLFASQRLARQDWMHGYINLKEYREQVLLGMFITLAADASAAFHARLIDRIAALSFPK